MMTRQRRNEIAYQIEKMNLRRNSSFRDVDNIKKEIGNWMKRPEILEVDISKDELIEYGKHIITEVFMSVMVGL